MPKLLKRKIIDRISEYLDDGSVVVLHGARQVGKTSIMMYLKNELLVKSRQVYYLDLEDIRILETLDGGVDDFLSYLRAAGADLATAEKTGEKIYVFIDEIQYMARPSSFLKLIADHHKYLKLFVSGSSSFAIKSKFSDSLVGRTVDFEIFNLSFEEFLAFKGWQGNIVEISKSPAHLERVIDLYKEYVFFGGYPKIVLEPTLAKKETYLNQIINTYVRKDLADLAQVKNIAKFNNLLKALAEQNGQLVNVATLAKIIGLSAATIDKYLFILENTYIIKLLAPYSTNARVEIAKAPKVFFYDTGICNFLHLNGLPQAIVGHAFENSVFLELAKKYGVDKINYWRSHSQNEVDFILRLDGKILPIEAKYNFSGFNYKSVKGFLDRYDLKDYRVAGLLDRRDDSHNCYPWEL